MCILITYDDRFLFEVHDRTIPPLMQPGASQCSAEEEVGGGFGQRAVLRQAKLTSPCHNLSVSLPAEVRRLVSNSFLTQLQEMEKKKLEVRLTFTSPSSHPSSFHLLPERVCVFVCMF